MVTVCVCCLRVKRDKLTCMSPKFHVMSHFFVNYLQILHLWTVNSLNYPTTSALYGTLNS